LIPPIGSDADSGQKGKIGTNKKAGAQIMLRFQQPVIDEVIRHAQKEAPIEACGFLAEKEGVVCLALPLSNVDASPEHYSLDPQEQFNALREFRKKGLNLCAVYHSHPVSPARPSQEDIRLAFDPNLSYVVISLAAPQPDIKSFKIEKGKVIPEEIITTDV
jgi:[CysO sulfur-carrier protein]-S-L-cysteine hydrolase